MGLQTISEVAGTQGSPESPSNQGRFTTDAPRTGQIIEKGEPHGDEEAGGAVAGGIGGAAVGAVVGGPVGAVVGGAIGAASGATAGALDDKRKDEEALVLNRTRCAATVMASGTTLTSVFGISDVLRTKILGHAGDIGHFASSDHFAS